MLFAGCWDVTQYSFGRIVPVFRKNLLPPSSVYTLEKDAGGSIKKVVHFSHLREQSMFMSCPRHPQRNYNIKISNKSLEIVTNMTERQ
jgi:hypothetical protein